LDVAILLCPAPQSTDWELPLWDPEHSLLIGWVVERESFEGGAPWAVRHLLSRALCRICAVTFLAHDGALVGHSQHKLVTTREPKVAPGMFDDLAYPWTQHGQAAFLSTDETPLITAKLLTEVVGQRKVEAAERAGFKGVLLPGVDGAVAGIWMFEPGGLDAFVTALQESGAEIHIVTEEQFRNALSY
jgi:hypothetical protein